MLHVLGCNTAISRTYPPGVSKEVRAHGLDISLCWWGQRANCFEVFLRRPAFRKDWEWKLDLSCCHFVPSSWQDEVDEGQGSTSTEAANSHDGLR